MLVKINLYLLYQGNNSLSLFFNYYSYYYNNNNYIHNNSTKILSN